MESLAEILSAYSKYILSHPTGFRLKRDDVGFEPIFDEEKSPGGLWIPDQAKGRCTQGIVKYKGPEVKDLNIGDYCIFSGYNGDIIAYGSELILVMPESMVAGVIEDDETIYIDGNGLGEYINISRKELVQKIAQQSKRYLQVKNAMSTIASRDKPV